MGGRICTFVERIRAAVSHDCGGYRKGVRKQMTKKERKNLGKAINKANDLIALVDAMENVVMDMTDEGKRRLRK